MSEIRFFALGGLGENGKNMYVIDVDHQYFILDAGIKYPTSELYGVDEIIPDYRMLMRIKDRIKGIFLSHAHEDHISALPHILKDLNVPVYGTKFTMSVAKDLLLQNKMNLDTLSLHTIDENSIIRFDNVRVSFFNTAHTIPESVGIAIQTLVGTIVYTSDFTFVQGSDRNYQTNFRKINELAERGVLLLLTESLGSATSQDTSISSTLTHRINAIFAAAEGRIIVSLFSSDLKKLQNVVDIALMHKKRIAIIGRKAQKIVNLAIEQGFLNIAKVSLVNLKKIDEKNKNDAKDLVCFVTGDRHEPFYALRRMCNQTDEFIKIDGHDTIILLTAPIPGTEKMAASTLDILYRSNANVEQIPKKLLTAGHATAEEIKMMINLLRPKYIVPVIGEYRHQYGVRLLAESLGYKPDDIFLLSNGDSLYLPPKKNPYVSYSDIKVGEILIDGTAFGDINEYVMHDREVLSADGVVILVANISAKQKKIVGEVEIVTKGFVYIKESTDLLDEIKEHLLAVIAKNLENKYINWNEFKNEIREDIGKFIYQATKRKPILIPVIIATEI